MLVKSATAIFLSLTATIALIGVFLALTPTTGSYAIPLLLMIFPTWLTLVCISYKIDNIRHIAAGLIGLTVVGFSLIALLKLSGMAQL